MSPMPPAQDRSRDRWIALALFAATFLVFLRAGGGEFVNYDDPEYVTPNAHVQAGLTLSGIRWALTTGDAANWHPLTWVSHMLDVSLFGTAPRGHHVMSVLLHAINAALAFVVLRRLTGAVRTSAVAAALFALHPLRVESVAWVAERKDVLSGLLFLLSLWAYARYAGVPAPGHAGATAGASVPRGDASGARRWYALTTLFCALGLMAKPMLVTLPCVLVLLDVWPLRRLDFRSARNLRRLVWEKVPWFLLAAASSVITYAVQKAGGAVAAVLPLEARLGNAIVSVPRYVGMVFWPANLAVLYPHPGHWSAVAIAAGAAFIIAISWLAWAQRAKRPWLLVGWLWFVGMLVPVIGIVQVGLQSVANRYTYLPVLGLEIAVLWTAREIFGGGWPSFGRGGRWHVALLAAAGAFSVLTFSQIGYWRNSLTLFNRTIAVAGAGNYLAFNNRGVYLFRQGQVEAAVADYQRSLAINPDYAEANNNLGEALAHLGRNAEAIPYYRRALRVQPGLVEAHNNLANALADVGEIPEAMEHYQFALSRRPEDPNVLNNYGATLAMAGRLDDAIVQIKKALAISPNYASAHANLGNILALHGRPEEALEHYRRALALEPTDARSYFNQGNVLSELGRLSDAVSSYQRAVQLAPVNPDAHAALGFTLARLGRRDEAIRQLQTALQQRPDFPQAKAWLDAVQAAK